MRAKTVKRLAILIAVIVLVGGSAYAAWRFQVGKMAQGVVAQADKALEEKRYGDAAELYQQHLIVVPDDEAVQLKYADVLLKLQRTPKNQQNAMAIYSEVLRRHPGNAEVRRQVAELAFEMGMLESARAQLSNLLKSAPNDGHLEFRMGQCYEADKDPENAAKYYQAAIEHGALERIEAADRLATLIRENEKLGKAEDADKVIDDMVKADPKNYRVYLALGNYHRRFNLEGAEDDYRKALELDRNQPETYLEMSQLAERSTKLDEARQILDRHRPFTFLLPTAMDVTRQVLDDGLAQVPHSVLLHRARADIERKAGRVDRWIELLEAGVNETPAQTMPRLELALILAARGDTGKLLRHIDELKNLGINKIFSDYLTAYYHVNSKEFEKARQILTSIQGGVTQNPDLNARINVLLAQCYGQLHEPEKQWEANQRAYNANPNNVTAQALWIDGLIKRHVNRGEIDEAINEYQRLLERSPQLDRKQLVNLMVARNRQRPPVQRDWHEVEVQLDEVAKAAPNSVEPMILRAMVYAERDQHAKAWEMLEAARSQFPEALEPWTAEADLLARQKKFAEALGRLDGAQEQLGDRIELRLSRATIWAVKGAPQQDVVKVLKDLAKNDESFPKEKRRQLLAYLAVELVNNKDLKGAEEIWSGLAKDDPEDVNPHLRLFDLALEVADKAGTDKQAEAQAEIVARINAIERIDKMQSRFCRARYLTWQAGRSKDAKDEVERKKDEIKREKLRTEARALLAELRARHDEWALIPLAEAELVNQELALEGLDESQKREKQESLITLYLRAIDLGARNPQVVRRAVVLLYTTGRSNQAVQLFSRMPAATELGGDLGQIVARAANAQNDQQAGEITRKAEEIARKAIADKPGSFQERIWLVNILMAGKRTDDAEAELRRAVADAEGDSDRWRTLVRFLIETKRLAKAEQALREAEKKLPQAPLALAECCERMGQAHEGPNTTAQAKKWYDEARQWFEKALAARKDPKDLTVMRRLLVEFLLRTRSVEAQNQLEAEKMLREILGQGAGAKDAVTFAWARRVLASIYINDNPRRPAEALALFNATEFQGAGTDPEDKRIWAKVLIAQGTPEHRQQAIAILESLVDEKHANPDDQRLLAQLEEVAGDWPKSRDQYRKLIERISNLADPDSFKRRVVYLAEFADRLLQSHQPAEDKDKDLAEAQGQIETLKRLQPEWTLTLALEVALYAARDDFEKAAALIRSRAEGPNLNPAVLPDLARMAEKIGQFDEFKLAEEIYGKIAHIPGAPFSPNKVLLIQFLVHRERFTEVLDLCESLRKVAADRLKVDGVCLDIFASPSLNVSPEQINRVVGWFEEEQRSGQQSMVYQIGLGNLFERAGFDQKAEDSYRAVVGSNDRDGIASNNLAWLMALNGRSWNDALAHINQALKIKKSNPDYLDTRGVVYLYAGQGQRAIDDLKVAVDAQPTAAKHFHLAQAYLAVNDKANAKKHLEIAKSKGLPNGLHRLEVAKYKQMLDDLRP